MDPVREQLLDQNYALPAAKPDLVAEARDLLKSCRPYIEKATFERDFSAYPILSKLDWFLKQDA